MTLRSAWLPCLLLALSPPALAQTTQGQQAVNTLTQAINQANTRVFVFAPWLKSQPIADALRLAIVRRGVRVTVLTSSSTLVEPGSYFLGLNLAGADLRSMTIKNLDTAAPFIIVDDRRLFTTSAPLLNDPLGAATRQLNDAQTLNSYLNWSRATTAAALSIKPVTAAYLLTIKRLKVPPTAQPKPKP